MNFETNISETKGGKHYMRGHELTELIATRSFVEIFFLLLKGSFPQKNEEAFLNALLVAAVENGVEAPSIFVPRVVASTGASLQAALASGVLSIGKNHGGAGEEAAFLFISEKDTASIVDEYLAAKKSIPGFGHKIYKEADPRAETLYEKAKQLGFSCRFFDRAYEIERVLAEKKGKKLPLNIDGALAAGTLELGFDPRLVNIFFTLSRLVGISAHVLEEEEQEGAYRRLSDKV